MLSGLGMMWMAGPLPGFSAGLLAWEDAATSMVERTRPRRERIDTPGMKDSRRLKDEQR
jgi:hypothetical protein